VTESLVLTISAHINLSMKPSLALMRNNVPSCSFLEIKYVMISNYLYISSVHQLDEMMKLISDINLKEVKKLEKLQCKTKFSTIALILVLAISATLAAFPVAAAQAQTKATYCFIGATPNPIGVNQQVLLHVGIPDPLTNVEMGYEGLTITITDPEGGQTTISDIRTDSTGGTGVSFTPDKVGTYKLQAHFPQQTKEFAPFFFGSPYNMTFLASDSETIELEVLSEDIEYHPGYSLPTEYWTRPIDAQLREWYTIAGSWLYDPENRYITNNDGPETAHILWTTELTIGGMAGGDVGLASSINQGAVGFGTGDAYEGLWSSRFILAGRLYYATYAAGALSMGTFPEPVEYHCVDLHTGEELWTKVFMDNATIDFAQLLYYQGFNYMGTFAYLYVTEGGYDFWTGTYLPGTWYAFSAYTGNLAFTILNVPSGTTLRDENGWLYALHVDQTNGWMGQWNMTGFIEASATGYYEGGGSWGNVVNGMTFDAGANTIAAEEGWDFNVTIPTGLQGSVQAAYLNDRVVGATIGSEVSVWGINIEPGKEGEMLFDTTWPAPKDWIEGNQSISWAADSEESLVGVLWSKELRQHYGISLETGELIWGPTPSQNYLDMYEGTMLTSHLIAYGRLYASGVGGILYCYNATTGDVLWTYEATDPYTEYLFGNNWWLGIPFITDGKIYLGSAEHSANQPLPRGAPFLCVDAESGDLIWRANGLFRQTGWGGLAIIGDSIIATMDTYDQRMYAIGRGASQTEAWIQNDVISQGNSVMIRGRVTDVSPGTEDANLRLRFPDGVPAVSDESMSDWMLYVYKQFERPADVEGVEVFLKIQDPNGDWYSTYVTADSNGVFSHMWAPGVVGEYHVTALFEGSESYYSSQATTTFGVDQAPEEAASAAEIADTTVNRLPAYPAIPAYLTIDLVILIIAAIGVVIGIVVYMALRKQK